MLNNVQSSPQGCLKLDHRFTAVSWLVAQQFSSNNSRFRTPEIISIILIKFTLGKLLVPLEKENFQPNGLPYPILSRFFFHNDKSDVSFQQERPRAQQWHSNESVQEVVQMGVASGTLDKSMQMYFLTDSVHHRASNTGYMKANITICKQASICTIV